jgi:hypothetical protein
MEWGGLSNKKQGLAGMEGRKTKGSLGEKLPAPLELINN